MPLYFNTHHYQNNCVLTISNKDHNDINPPTIALQILGDNSASMADLINIKQSKLDVCKQTTNFIIPHRSL